MEGAGETSPLCSLERIDLISAGVAGLGGSVAVAGVGGREDDVTEGVFALPVTVFRSCCERLDDFDSNRGCRWPLLFGRCAIVIDEDDKLLVFPAGVPGVVDFVPQAAARGKAPA